ncbi:MAG: hypothetical protein IPG17_29135 [Sandaracinaceae bacterium]|nr:hypothetical protein [Sandaracinaceae bacterium]
MGIACEDDDAPRTLVVPAEATLIAALACVPRPRHARSRACTSRSMMRGTDQPERTEPPREEPEATSDGPGM